MANANWLGSAVFHMSFHSRTQMKDSLYLEQKEKRKLVEPHNGS